MGESIIKNPFVGCTARDMQFDEVRQYWCSPFTLYNLNESELFLSRTPIVIEGIRGSGKTMILKYLSYPVQKEFIANKTVEEKLSYLKKNSFGSYFRYKEDFCNLIELLDCKQTLKDKIFKHYFEMFVAREIIQNIDYVYEGQASSEMIKAVSTAIGLQVESLDSAIDGINERLWKMDSIINESLYEESWQSDIQPLLGTEDYIYNLVNRITEGVKDWKNILFSVVLDEYENLGVFKRIVNTLIKQVDETCNLTYRIGMRPAGMDGDNATRIGIERLQVDRDYILRKLVFSDSKEYKKFVVEVSRKRLGSVEVYADNKLTDIGEILGKNEDWDEEAKAVAKGKKQFELIEKCFDDEKEFEDAVRLLSNDEKLLEMYNILLVSRGDYSYLEVEENCRNYIKLRNEKRLIEAKGDVRKYQLGYGDKYRLALLFLLRAIYGESKWYYSLNTFVFLSSGSINDFISLCRNTFKYVNRDMIEDLIKGKTIPISTQTLGARDTAEDQRRKVAQSNRHGNEMYSFIENLGGAFEEYHRDSAVKYPETNQFAFTDEIRIKNDPELSEYLIDLINSGVIIRKQNRQLKSIGQPRGNIYQLNRIFAPLYQFSYRTRGGYNQMITTELFGKMLKENVPPIQFIKKCKEVDSVINKPEADDDSQMSIFDFIEGSEKWH